MRTACHRLRGGDWGRARCTPHVADAQVGDMRGYARLPPPAGVAEMSAVGHRLRFGAGAGAGAAYLLLLFFCDL